MQPSHYPRHDGQCLQVFSGFITITGGRGHRFGPYARRPLSRGRVRTPGREGAPWSEMPRTRELSASPRRSLRKNRRTNSGGNIPKSPKTPSVESANLFRPAPAFGAGPCSPEPPAVGLLRATDYWTQRPPLSRNQPDDRLCEGRLSTIIFRQKVLRLHRPSAGWRQ